MAGIIKTVGLRKAYKIGGEKVVALDLINLEIEKGQVCCILGTSGSGKSTLLNQLAGLEKPTRGDVYIKGKKISAMSEKQLAHFRQRNVGFVFQSYNLLQGMSAVDNVAIPLTFRGMARRKRVNLAKEMLKSVGLGKRMYHKPNEMSGGQQQRVGIARAFVARPDVVFADEPTGNLDTRTTREVMDLFLGFAREQHITIVLVTHDQHLARYADRIVTIVDGNVISDVQNVSLYDITNSLHQSVQQQGGAGNWRTVAVTLLHNAAEYGDGVPAQALERCLLASENPRVWAEGLLNSVAGQNEKDILTRLIKETGVFEEEDKAAEKAARQSAAAAPEPSDSTQATAETQTVEIIDATAESADEATEDK